MKKLFSLLLFIPLLLIIFLSANSENYTRSEIKSSSGSGLFSDDLDCSECHSYLVESKTKHAAALDNGCTNCHISNGKEHPGDSIVFSLSDNVPQLCYMCHDGIESDIKKQAVVHGIVTQNKSCLNCHSPHSSNNAKLLTSSGNDLCLNCHNKTISSGTRKLSNIKNLLSSSKVIHPAIEGGCITCHKPHASENDFLLTKSFPSGMYVSATKENFGLCFECHESGLLLDKTTSSATNFRSGTVNMHYLHMNGVKARSCAVCHDMHASNNEHLINEKVDFGQWTFNMNYTPDESGGSCSPGCHSEKKYTR